ncbi:hypothetical protein SADUNF_Sadunf16G0274400 [Salix dunnii]|uniref:Uncharacterized protein n=1 Tax=Salix dunnii TaxID=1413687 RepID=A0A835MHP2_9ROSI|nr:hypothetical protein SADUNF_Sadunf16G0274400 [Salix dunnii]
MGMKMVSLIEEIPLGGPVCFGTPLKRRPFQGPDRYRTIEFSVRICSGFPLGSFLKVKLPLDGSSGDFHDDKYRSKPVLKSLPNFIPDRSVSHG